MLATIHSTESLDAFEKLLNCARDSQNAKEFKRRLKISGFIPKKANEHYKKIQSIVKKNRYFQRYKQGKPLELSQIHSRSVSEL